MRKYEKLFSTQRTLQSQRIPGSAQVLNSAGGYAWPVDDWMRLDRFLILGSEGGSYYSSERTLTVENADAVLRCINSDGLRVVERLTEISVSGRAPKNDPAIFVLAMCAKLGDDATRKAAHAALPKVCRIGSHIMMFAELAEAFGGWGRGTRNAVARWYNSRPARKLAYQVVKYQARGGWSNRDLLRLSHPKAPSHAHGQLYRWIVKGELTSNADPSLELVDAFERAKRATTVSEITRLIREHRLPRETVPTQWLTEPAVWDALLEHMPMTAMIRNLATMTRVGLLKSNGPAVDTIAARLSDQQRLQRARIHPIAVLAALVTYQAGRGARGRHSWSPVRAVVDALDTAFYRTFDNVEPVDSRLLLALDVSSSMTCGTVAGIPGLTPRIASAALALITAATERNWACIAFTGGTWSGEAPNPERALSELDISPKQRLDDVVRRVSKLPFGATDCALPMLYALEKRIEVDTFVIYTDSETWVGSVHPVQALRKYRAKTGIAAKLIVVGMVSNGFTIADPNDAGMLDVVGFDTRTPTLIGDFARA